MTKRATVFLKTIEKLKDKQWDDIYKAALALHQAEPVTLLKQDQEEATEGESDGEVLADPMYDDVPEE